MRSTDTPEKFAPLGSPIRPEAPKPPEPEWKPAQTPGYERNAKGEIRKKGT